MQESPNAYIAVDQLITGNGQAVIHNAALRVEAGRIVDVGPAAGVALPADASVSAYRFEDATLLPGLIDAHVHLTFRRGENIVEHAARVSDAEALLRGVQAAARVLRAGVTTVRDCGARGRVGQALRDGVRDGFIAGPRILASGPPVTTTGGHLWPIGYEADTQDEVRRAVRRLVKEGADFIKVCATGGGMTPGNLIGRAQYSTPELRAVVDEAHRFGRHVAAHVHGTEGIARAVEAGIDTLEHCTWLDESGTDVAFDEQVARTMATQGLVANIASSPPRELIERGWRPDAGMPDAILRTGPGSALSRWELAQRMRALGVRVCFSTDTIQGSWDDGHDLSYLAQALVSAADYAPLDVLRMITAVAAQAVGLGQTVGTIEEGKVADLLIVTGDPLADIASLHRVRAVFAGGIPVVLQDQ